MYRPTKLVDWCQCCQREVPTANADKTLAVWLRPKIFDMDASASVIHPMVTSYLDYNSASLTRFDPAEDNLAFPTPRSWEMVSNILSAVSSDIGKVYPLIAGCIFRYLRRGYEALPSCLVIFTDGMGEYPPEEEAMGIPVLWIISGGEKAPSWGSVARIRT